MLSASVVEGLQGGNVILDGVALSLVPGSYAVEDADRFGQKISVGSLKYADFNPYENAHSQSSFTGGYGLRRFADVENEDALSAYYYRNNRVETAYGPAFIGSLIANETTGLVAPAVWMGEFTTAAGVTRFVAVGGTKIVYRNAGAPSGTWTDTGLVLSAAAKKGAVGVFGNRLVIGHGALATAQYTTDLATLNNVQDTTPANLYVFAFSADHAAAYIAGGPAVTDTTKVTSSSDGGTGYSTKPTQCGNIDSPITALAPGGGIVAVYVGKTKELGQIAGSQYQTLVPYDSALSTNSVGMHWWMGRGGDEQRGPIMLVFPRDHSTWIYQPSSDSAGQAFNISPWAQPGLRPDVLDMGITKAIQGTARWLYMALQDTSGNSFLVRRDAISGANHLFGTKLTGGTDAMGITSVPYANPILFVGWGNDVGAIVLPLDGEDPRDDPNTVFETSGDLSTAEIDLGFPDEDKLWISVRVSTDDADANATILVAYSLDGGGEVTLGTVTASPVQTLLFPTNTHARRCRLRFYFDDGFATFRPSVILNGYSIRTSIIPLLYRIWTFQCPLPGDVQESGTEDVQDPYDSLLNHFWKAMQNGTVLNFTDRWMDAQLVRVLHMKEAEILAEPDKTPQTVVEFRLLEVDQQTF